MLEERKGSRVKPQVEAWWLTQFLKTKSSHQLGSLPWISTSGPFLQEEAKIVLTHLCVISHLPPPPFHSYHHLLHQFMEPLQASSSSVLPCFASRLVWHSNTIHSISSSGSSPGTCYLFWPALLACKYLKYPFLSAISPFTLLQQLLLASISCYHTGQQHLRIKQGIKIPRSDVAFNSAKLFSHFSNRHSWFWLGLNSEYFEIFTRTVSY